MDPEKEEELLILLSKIRMIRWPMNICSENRNKPNEVVRQLPGI